MFQDKLKDLRKEKGITQNELAKEIFVSRSLIAKFETGTVFPSREILEKIALYFDVPISELIEQDEATLVAVEAQDISKKINLVALITILIIAASYTILQSLVTKLDVAVFSFWILFATVLIAFEPCI